jgi:hypothetical protein
VTMAVATMIRRHVAWAVTQARVQDWQLLCQADTEQAALCAGVPLACTVQLLPVMSHGVVPPWSS